MMGKLTNLLALCILVLASGFASVQPQCVGVQCSSSSCISNGVSVDQYNCPSSRCIGATARGCSLNVTTCDNHCLGQTQDGQVCLSNGRSNNYKICVKSGQPVAPSDNCTCPSPPNANTGACPVNKIEMRIKAAGVEGAYIQCVDPPNYDTVTRVMAFSWCWSYKCFPESFQNKNISAETVQTAMYNIPRIPWSAEATLNIYKPVFEGVSVSAVYFETNSTKQMLVDSTRNITTPVVGWSLVRFIYTIPSAAVNGDSASVVLRVADGSGIMPPNDTAVYQSGLVRVDRLVTTDSDMEALQRIVDAGVKIAGYYVLIPGELRTYATLTSCSDVDAFVANITAAFKDYGVQNVTVISCLQSSPPSGARRALRQTSLSGSSAVISVETHKYPTAFSQDVLEGGTKLEVSTCSGTMVKDLGASGYDVTSLQCTPTAGADPSAPTPTGDPTTPTATPTNSISTSTPTSTIIIATVCSVVGVVLVASVIGIIVYNKNKSAKVNPAPNSRAVKTGIYV